MPASNSGSNREHGPPHRLEHGSIAPDSGEPYAGRPDTDSAIGEAADRRGHVLNRGLSLELTPAGEEDAGPDDATLLGALRRGEPNARQVLVRRFLPMIERLVASTLGIDGELLDVVQDVFVRVLEGVHKVRDPAALESWVASLAVFTARGRIRRRRRWRWINFVRPEALPEVPVRQVDWDIRTALQATYRVLDTLPTDERLAFTLRFMAEMELTEVAAACQVSLATIKRRLARAETKFLAAARQSEILNDRLARGGRWATR